MEARNKTPLNTYFKVTFSILFAPLYAPMEPPRKATATHTRIMGWRLAPSMAKPENPAIEFTKINKAEMAAVSLMFAHPNNNMIGLRIIPPPIPIRPEKKPSVNPMKAERR